MGTDETNHNFQYNAIQVVDLHNSEIEMYQAHDRAESSFPLIGHALAHFSVFETKVFASFQNNTKIFASIQNQHIHD